MQALSDPVRVGIVRRLLEAGEGGEFACKEFPMRLSKATRSHHFQILRDAGLIRTRVEGTRCMTSLRRDEVQKRFPGLLGMIENSS
jgi:DNA-binding transcriptional ArsR family regulator